MGDAGASALESAILSDAGLGSPELLAVLDHIAHPIFVKDRNFRWVLMNAAAEKLMGFPRVEMLGRTDHDYFPKDEADFFRSKDVETFRTGKTVVVEQEALTDAKGELHTLATTKTPLRDKTGAITHLVGIIHDVTALVRAEGALRVANEDLERRVAERTRALEVAQQDLVRKERLAVLGRLAGGVAHQIRNPLGAIRNAVSVISRHSDDPTHPSFREAIRILQDESIHANRIVTDLVSYARVRSPLPRPLSIPEMVRELVDGLGVPVHERGSHASTAETSGPLLVSGEPGHLVALVVDDVPDAYVDELQTYEALRNLLRNGIEAMPLGGTLHVTVDCPEAELVRVVVEDEGEGIPESVRRRMFEPLVTTKPTGLGLGLVTAQSLVVSQGGRLEWHQHEGRGARFEVLLPLARARQVNVSARSA